MSGNRIRDWRVGVCAGAALVLINVVPAWGAGPEPTRVPTDGHRGAGGGVPTVSLVPVSSSGPYMIDGGQIVVPRGGVQVTLEIHFHDWGFPRSEAGLLSFNFTVDSQGYLGANAIPPNPGVDLHPLGFPGEPHLGGFITAEICSNSGRDCSHRPSACQVVVDGPCVPNPRFAVSCCDPLWGVWTGTQDYEFGAVVEAFSNGPCDHLCASAPPGYCTSANHCDADGDCAGAECVHGPSYVGTLIVEIPPTATGSYPVGIIDDINDTYYCADSCLFVRRPASVGATITIQAACCLPGGGCALLSPAECEAAGGMPTDQVDCAFDADGDGVAICADECPDDPLKADPGICGCGVSDDDADDDGVADCVDVCPGVDDAAFAPGCAGAIPVVSTWGVIVLALLLAAAGKVGFGRRAGVDKTTT